MILVDEDTNSILTDDIKFSAGFGHEHEGGASSIFFHAPPSPGGTFFCIPNICPWGNQEFNQVDPGGAESYDYEYKYSEEIKEVANVSDGDRLVGGRVTNTRSKFQKEESSAQEISILGRLELEWNGQLHGMQW